MPFDWITPVTGLIGVLVGGVITAGTQLFIEAKKEKRERIEHQRKEQAALRQGLRLASVELRTARQQVQLLNEHERGQFPANAFPHRMWDKYCYSFATHLTPKCFNALSEAYVSVSHVANSEAMTLLDRESVGILVDRLDAAITVVDSLLSDDVTT